LSLTIEGDRAVWLCHHCQWSGAVNDLDEQRPARPPKRRPAAPVKPTHIPGKPTPGLLQWFAKRRISAATVERNRIWAIREYIPGLDGEAPVFILARTFGREIALNAFPAGLGNNGLVLEIARNFTPSVIPVAIRSH